LRRQRPSTGTSRRHVTRDDPVVGWRFWGVSLRDGERRLRSPFRDTLWPVDEPLVAECFGTRRTIGLPEASHEPPADGCRCGVYGGSYRAVRAYLDTVVVQPAEAAVIGRAALWGEVVDDGASWRAQFAYPDRLLVPTLIRDAYQIAAGLEAYRVPVVLLDAAETFTTLQPNTYLRGAW